MDSSMLIFLLVAATALVTAARGFFQILAYGNIAQAALATNADTPAIADPNFTRRPGGSGGEHWIFTEPYLLMGMATFGTSLTNAQLFDATLNAINVPQSYPTNQFPYPPSNPNVHDFRLNPVPLPINEEIQLQLSNNLGSSTEKEFGIIWIKPVGDTSQIPQASYANNRVLAGVTFNAAATAGVWTTQIQLSFTNPLKGGNYIVAGMYVIGAPWLAFRLNFVRAPYINGRKLLPGNLCENVFGNVPLKQGLNWMGVMGQFNNFELPQLDCLAWNTANAATYTGYMDLIYQGAGPQQVGTMAPAGMSPSVYG